MASTVSPEHILKELAALWRTEGDEVLRACTMTLIVLAERDDDPQGLGETLAALMPEHPARAIIVRLDGAGERSLAERVYQQCWMPFGQRRQVCCEQVEIAASDSALADLPSVLLPLAVADLPVFLWCRSARLFGMPELEGLAALAHKVIVNTGVMPDPAAALSRMLDSVRSGRTIGDLAWTRLTRWRNMLAQVFENRARLSRLGSVRSIRVEHPGERPNTSTLLMGCWVRASLGGQPQIQFERGEWKGTGTSPLVLSVRVQGEEIDVELRRDQDRMFTTIDGEVQCTHLPMATPYLLMREELGISRRDAVFERTLASAAALKYPNG